MAEYIIWSDENLPEKDFTRITRCRDCKHSRRNGTVCFNQRFTMRETEFDLVYVEPDGFCSLGTPKEAKNE